MVIVSNEFARTLTIDDVRKILTNAGFAYSSTNPYGQERWVHRSTGDIAFFNSEAPGDSAMGAMMDYEVYKLIAESHWRYVINLEIEAASSILFNLPDENAPDFISEYCTVGVASIKMVQGLIDGSLMRSIHDQGVEATAAIISDEVIHRG